jgi:hypothetical protein
MPADERDYLLGRRVTQLAAPSQKQNSRRIFTRRLSETS